jgi:alpha-tubulin suppressor-like RCC1 family protein
LGLGESRRAGVTDKRLRLCFPSPTLVELLANVTVTRVSCGAVHTAVISHTGNLYTFGCGDGGRLGLGNNSDCFQPELVSSLQNERVIEVFCSNWHTLCIATPRDRLDLVAVGWVCDINFIFKLVANVILQVYAFGSGLNGQVCQSYHEFHHVIF